MRGYIKIFGRMVNFRPSACQIEVGAVIHSNDYGVPFGATGCASRSNLQLEAEGVLRYSESRPDDNAMGCRWYAER